ncbi:MAG: peptide chain release factor 3 [Phycisphaerales bacterium]|nr:peptide chain release factor 3 [Phycisphaerales bacterium]
MTPTEEIARRRAFAIISHPDAGKTTLTEKFLLYGGAVQLAGSVTARKDQRTATSDWMELEKKRGISISSTVLQFDYQGYRINLLDTPGHKDFSEDTYRVLTAVDGVVMVIDAGKGIEAQTRKLFEICRRRGVPIFTFMNKLDRPTRDPMELMDELETVLGIQAYAMNWPLGTGSDFAGVYDRGGKQAHFFERTAGGAYRAPETIHDLGAPAVRARFSDETYARVAEELETLEIAGSEFDQEKVLAGQLTPVLFGSASNNFGVQLLLDSFLAHSSPPRSRVAAGGRVVEPTEPAFSGFVFKIQANMDPRHRDRIAFVRVCSGKFTREMAVTHAQSGKRVRLNSSHKLFGRERETVDEAYPGDVIGLVGHAGFGIGDTLTEDPAIVYDEIPRFAPEVFAYIHSQSTSQFKRFREGLDQLLQEGVVQGLKVADSMRQTPLLAAVGPLQFEVVQYRLESEYGAGTRLENAPWGMMRWVAPDTDTEALGGALPSGSALATDADEQPVVLFPSEWAMGYFQRQNKAVELSATPFQKAR